MGRRIAELLNPFHQLHPGSDSQLGDAAAKVRRHARLGEAQLVGEEFVGVAERDEVGHLPHCRRYRRPLICPFAVANPAAARL
jgi:hypothetical protein